MATSDKPKQAEGGPPDLLPVIRRAGILTDRQYTEVRGKVARGEYPHDPDALARRLVEDRVLTNYQAQRLLKNKSNGLMIGRYVILDRLGSGSMGRVYKAHHLLMGRVVALKVVAPEIASNERVVARFQREMRLAGRLDHPNVVRAYDADQIGGILYIVMEYVPGQSLGQRLRARGPLSPTDVAEYAAQAARGLAHAHAQGIVHRDIKPSNLFLNEDKQIKILDLGLGALMEADNHSSFATADGIAVGTVDYMSPEQACGREVDGRSDLYSLGCAMYHLISGRVPFPGDSPIERLGKRINGRHVPIPDVRPDVPPSLVRVIDRLLGNRPEDRYADATEAAEALEALNRRKAASVVARSPVRALHTTTEVAPPRLPPSRRSGCASLNIPPGFDPWPRWPSDRRPSPWWPSSSPS